MKKKWKKPLLRVIVRTKSEEKVLSACKTPSLGGPGGPDDCMGAVIPCETIGTIS